MRYKLRTTAIVSGIHPNQPQRVGTVWEPKDRKDVLEAEALAKVGFAEQTNEAATVGESKKSEQPKVDPRDAELAEVLDGTVSDVEDALAEGEFTDEDLARLVELEQSGKDRKGVLDAIAQYQDAG